MQGLLKVVSKLNHGKFISSKDEGSLSIIGVDVGLPIIRSGIFGFDLYFDYAKIVDFGSGTALGGIISLNGLGLVNVRAKMERRFNGDSYIPSYFNSFYELERFKYDESTNTVSSKIQILQNIGNVGDGYYGELLVRLLGTFDILGSYQRLDDHPESGIFHAATQIAPDGIPYVVRAGYDKVNIQR